MTTRSNSDDKLLDAARKIGDEERVAWDELGEGASREVLEKLKAIEEIAGLYREARGHLEADDAETQAEPPLAVDSESVEPPAEIGPYRILERLGQGGMGDVYLAERADDAFQKRVAIKLMRSGWLSGDAVVRFRTERQILATLEHPNIARLLDGGSTEDRLPYVVMEFIEGFAIDEYCEQQQLSVEERLELFVTVCSAVSYAHSRLVVHRDIKPSNILVTGDGVPKLLDFGIAKLLDPDEAGVSVVITGRHQRLLTPLYASPEQVRGEPITIASDVYSLGILLYLMLTGQRPFSLSGKSPTEIERIITEETPSRPSTAVNRPASDQQTTDSITTPDLGGGRRLQRRLAGDLDNIVLKALRKDPLQRYATVGELADDIRRHLEGLPVLARPQALGYRLSKFVRRHKVGFAAASLVSLSLVAGLLVALWQAGIARREANNAQEVKAFVLNLLELSDPNRSRGDLTTRELLDEGAQRIGELDDQPAVQVEMRAVIGSVYKQLGLYEQARPLLTQALEQAREVHGDVHEQVVHRLNDLASLSYLGGDYDEAVTLNRESLRLSRELRGTPNLLTARCLSELSVTLRAKRELDEAGQLARESLEIRRTLLGERHADVAESLVNIGVVDYLKGDDSSAEALYGQALEIQRSLLGTEHLSVASTMNRMAILKRRAGAFDDAIALYQQVLDIYRTLLGERHPDIATVLNNLGSVYSFAGEWPTAEAFHREAMEMQRELLGDNHPDVAFSMNNLAVRLLARRDDEAALDLFRQALEIRQRTLPEGHSYTTNTLLGLGQVLLRLGRLEESETFLREALVPTTTWPNDGMSRGYATSLLGVNLSRQGRYDDAEAALVEALELIGTKNPRELRNARDNVRRHFERRGQPERAEAYRAPDARE